jgi:8-oxo-dGTP diphosphatase / 2-hydroxy-dATP diphosphatase
MLLTLVIVHKNNKVLLGMKKRGFGAGKYNGFGGKLLPGENLIDCAQRELREEAGIEAEEIEELGRLVFKFQKDPEILDVHVFKVRRFSGKPIETEEMAPRWFDTNELPYSEMWPDDQYWLPLFLKNKLFKGYFEFDNESKIIKKEIYQL